MVEREDLVDLHLNVPVSLYRQLQALQEMLNEDDSTFFNDVLSKGGAVKEVDQVYDQVVAIIDDEKETLITLFEFMDDKKEGNPPPFEQKILPYRPKEQK